MLLIFLGENSIYQIFLYSYTLFGKGRIKKEETQIFMCKLKVVKGFTVACEPDFQCTFYNAYFYLFK
jgi:hypothetical protein